MEFFKANTKINFMKQRKWAALLSLILFILSLGSLYMNGLDLGLEFTGGTQVQLHFQQAPNLDQVRSRLEKAGFHDILVQNYGSLQDISISLASKKTQNESNEKLLQQAVVKEINKVLPKGHVEQVNYIGGVVGKELATSGVLAILVAVIATMIYIALRFEYRFAISSTLALIHDPV